MLNPLNFLSKFIKSSNQKELDRIAKIIERVNSYEPFIKEIKDEEFPKKTKELKKKLVEGKNIDELLEVHGIGPAKVEKFGQDLVEFFRE